MADAQHQQQQQLEPAFVCTYGGSGAGKTVDALYSFPRALFIAPPGALKPAVTVVGYAPRQTKIEAPHLMAVTATLPLIDPRTFDAVVVDDFSLLVDRTVAVLEKKYKGWDLWGKLTDEVIGFRDAARRMRIHVLVNAHEKGPETKDNGTFVRGGPALPGKLPNSFPPACDLVLRAAVDASRLGWPGVYRCSVLLTDWSTKDRHGVTPDMAPMNVGEILRLAGYQLRRLEGLEWQDEAVAKITAFLLGQTTREQEVEVMKMAIAGLKAKYSGLNDLHIRWTLRDAVDRAALIRARATVLGAFTSNSVPAGVVL